MTTTANIDTFTSGLLSQFLQLDLEDWNEVSITNTLAELGGTSIDERRFHIDGRTGHLSTDLQHDPAISVPLTGFIDHAEAIEAFETARDVVSEQLGQPQLCGGPGPWWRWRDEHTSIRLRFSTLSRGNACVSLEALHTDRSEGWEFRASRHLGELPYVWRRILRPQEVDGLMSCGDQRAADWDDLTARLTDTLHALITDLPVLGNALPVNLSIEEDFEDWHEDLPAPLYFRFKADGMLLDHRADPTVAQVTALSPLGWTPPSREWIEDWETVDEPGWPQPETDQVGFTRWFPGGPATAAADAAAAAALAVATIRASDTELSSLRYQTLHAGENLRIQLPGLGI